MRLTRNPATRFQDEAAARYGEVVNDMHATLWKSLLVALFVVDVGVGSAAAIAFFRDAPHAMPTLAFVAVLLSALAKVLDLASAARSCRAAADEFGRLLARRDDLDDAAFSRGLQALQHRHSSVQFGLLKRRAYNQVCDEIGEPGAKYTSLLAG